MKKKINQNHIEATTPSGATDYLCGGVSFVETHRHLEDLLRAAQGRALPFDSHHLTSGEATTTTAITTEHHHHHEHDDGDDDGVYLCLDCIERYDERHRASVKTSRFSLCTSLIMVDWWFFVFFAFCC